MMEESEGWADCATASSDEPRPRGLPCGLPGWSGSDDGQGRQGDWSWDLKPLRGVLSVWCRSKLGRSLMHGEVLGSSSLGDDCGSLFTCPIGATAISLLQVKKLRLRALYLESKGSFSLSIPSAQPRVWYTLSA